MIEVPKRLTPTQDVVRELYLKSGNECAFPGCSNRIIDKDGIFIAQLCHIEAAEPGGERFNPKQTNEERRAFSNLMLMCYKHHKITNDVNLYPVDRLRRMKEDHESKFTDIVETIRIPSSVNDITASQSTVVPSRLKRCNEVLDWQLTDDELASEITYFEEYCKRFDRLTRAVRQLFSIIVERCEISDSVLSVPYSEIKAIVDIDQELLNEYLEILERYKLAYTTVYTYYGEEYEKRMHDICIYKVSDLDICGVIKDFCRKTGILIESFLVGLQFDQLD